MDLREFLNLTETSASNLANRANLTRSTVSHILTKKTNPSLLNACKLCRATYGMVSVETMLKEEDQKKLDEVKKYHA